MNQDIPDFLKPYWIPSLTELRSRLKGDKEISIPFRFCDETIGSISIHDFETTEQFMNKLYESNYLKSYDDKFAFWLYKGYNSKEEDLALLNDEIMLEVLSFCEENGCFLLLQRRILCSMFPLNYPKLDPTHLDSFFHQIKRNYIIKDKFSDYCKADTLARLAAILYIIELVMKNKKIIAKTEKLQKKLKNIVPESWLSKLTQPQLIQKIIPYLIQNNLITQDLWSLKQEFLNVLKSFHLFGGSQYECQIQESISGKNTRVEMMLNVNIFGIFFYKVRDKPVRCIFYEELVYAVGNDYECNLFYVEKESFVETKLDVFCRAMRARELYEDIVSYCILRTKEKTRLIYGLDFLHEFKSRFFSFYLVIFNYIKEIIISFLLFIF